MSDNTKQSSPVITQDPLNVFRFENEWNVGIFDCCDDCRLTMCSYFCWLYMFCTLMSDLKESCCSYICIPFPLIVFRTKLRSNLRIKGSIWKDSLTSLCLPWCALIQMKSELKQRDLIN
ncbi:placenta-specific protein 8 -like [Brachionus plicatilis]|uniref:Placenta-specific protein 8-like n=1 Tax=Brachionus plicatilis TaxID=10195 RepID=A0A3M7T7S7_BRAPC|nr:placenta-specific protein 8 -like [Brachionus plicatilis]